MARYIYVYHGRVLRIHQRGPGTRPVHRRAAIRERRHRDHGARAENFARADWKQIVKLYRRLAAIENNPVVELNLAVARSYAENPEVGLAFLDRPELATNLDNYQP